MAEGSSADVIVIGAGLSGLTAARRIEHAGRHCVVVEARDRVGGRTLTRTVGGVPVDLGASLVTPAADRLITLAEEVGVRVVAHGDTGRKLLDHSGHVHPYRGPLPRLPALVLGELGLTVGRLEAMARLVPPGRPMAARLGARWDELTVEEWLSSHVRHPEARAVLAAAVSARFAAEPGELSFLSLLFANHSSGGLAPLLAARPGPTFGFTGGAQTLSQRLAARLRAEIRLASPVTRIVQDDAGVEVHAADAVLRARRVVLSVPPAVARTITFEPALDPARAELHARTPGGRVRTHVFVYDEPFWRHDGLSGEMLSTAAPIRHTFDATPAGCEAGVLATFVVGDEVDRLRALEPEARREAIVEHLVRVFGDAAASPRADAAMDWSRDSAGGGWASFWPPGVLGRTGRAFRRAAGRIHFAGAAAAKRGNGRLDGAVEAGERAADEVLDALRRDHGG